MLHDLFNKMGKYAERGTDVLENTCFVLVPRYVAFVLIALALVPVFLPLAALGYLADKVKWGRK